MNIQNHVLLIVNPIAGGSEKGELIETIITEIDKREMELRIFETTGNDDEGEIQRLIKEHNPQRILAAGGDGTVQLVSKVAKNHSAILGIIPAGSANGLAVNFGIPNDLQQQLDIALGEYTLAIDLLLVNNHLCLHIADLGINAELIKNYENSNLRGKLGYLLQSIPTLFKTEGPFDFEIEANGERFIKKGVLLAIANANKFGTGAVINPEGKMNDGLFEILIFKNLDFIEIIKTLNDDWDMDPDFMESITTDSAVIKCLTKVPFQIDGEYIGEMDTVKATILKEKLEIALPFEFYEQYKL